MDVTMLPMVWPGTAVREALDRLDEARRAGVVVQNFDDSYVLFYTGQLLRARDQMVATVGQVPGGHPVLLLDVGKAQQFSIDLVRPNRTADAYEKLLEANGVDYALAGESSDMAMVVTKHEGQTLALNSTGGYKCTGTPTHYFPEPRVDAGDPCPMYPECSTPDRSRPIVRPA
jgi:hypothetical protein